MFHIYQHSHYLICSCNVSLHDYIIHLRRPATHIHPLHTVDFLIYWEQDEGRWEALLHWLSCTKFFRCLFTFLLYSQWLEFIVKITRLECGWMCMVRVRKSTLFHLTHFNMGRGSCHTMLPYTKRQHSIMKPDHDFSNHRSWLNISYAFDLWANRSISSF